MRLRRLAWAPLALLAVFSMAGCATMRVSDQLDRRLAAEDYTGGLEDIEKAKSQYSGANSLLYYFDRGSLEQRAGAYPASSQDLEQAELLIDDLYTKSITEGIASFLVNDTTLAYSGEDFEQVAVNIMKTLNYLFQGDFQGAQVEARKVNNRLLALSDKYGKEAVYKEDAFARYLSAFAYEAGGEYNDAYLDYKNAYQGFLWYDKHFGMPVPPFIQDDLLRLSRWLGFDEAFQSWRETFGQEHAEPGRRPTKSSEVLLVVFDGMIPRKQTRFVEAPVMDPDNRPYLLKVAFPVIRYLPPALGSARCLADTGAAADGFVVEPLAEIAAQNLDQRIGLIKAKAIARAIAKYIASSQASQAARKANEGLGLLVGVASNIYSVVSEQADTRSWRTLPNRFGLIRMSLPPGKHQLTVRTTDFNGNPRPDQVLDVELKKGEKKVIPVYAVR